METFARSVNQSKIWFGQSSRPHQSRTADDACLWIVDDLPSLSQLNVGVQLDETGDLFVFHRQISFKL